MSRPPGGGTDTAAAARTAGFLAHLQPAEEQDLRSRGGVRRFKRGASLFNEGERSDRVVCVLQGRVKVASYSEDGREIVLAVRGPGDLLGELSALDGEPTSATVAALDPVEALVMSASQFRSFLEDQPRVSLLLLETLSRRLRDADRKRLEFGAYDTVGRVARRLIELAERFGDGSTDHVRIDLPLSQEELAGWVGSSRESVSKALRTLRTRGWIETDRRQITVRDLAALRSRAT
ncbi:MAG TPA: Crp/Fnr family transcriptional regulator [Actinomycetota bacterium]|nr:Crp/Fnr family transcriptional regulator [Actinomycetota bacterium]